MAELERKPKIYKFDEGRDACWAALRSTFGSVGKQNIKIIHSTQGFCDSSQNNHYIDVGNESRKYSGSSNSSDVTWTDESNDPTTPPPPPLDLRSVESRQRSRPEHEPEVESACDRPIESPSVEPILERPTEILERPTESPLVEPILERPTESPSVEPILERPTESPSVESAGGRQTDSPSDDRDRIDCGPTDGGKCDNNNDGDLETMTATHEGLTEKRLETSAADVGSENRTDQIAEVEGQPSSVEPSATDGGGDVPRSPTRRFDSTDETDTTVVDLLSPPPSDHGEDNDGIVRNTSVEESIIYADYCRDNVCESLSEYKTKIDQIDYNIVSYSKSFLCTVMFVVILRILF